MTSQEFQEGILEKIYQKELDELAGVNPDPELSLEELESEAHILDDNKYDEISQDKETGYPN